MIDRNIFHGTIDGLYPDNRVLIALEVNSIPPINSHIYIKDGENEYKATILDTAIGEEKENFPDIRYIRVKTDLPVDFILESRVEMRYISIPHFKHKRSTQKSKKRGNPKRSAPKRRKTKHSKLKSKKH